MWCALRVDVSLHSESDSLARGSALTMMQVAACNRWAMHRNKWNAGQLEKQRNIGGKQTDHIYNRLGGILMQFFNIVIFIALVERITRPCERNCTKEEKENSRSNKIIGAVLFEMAVALVLVLLIVQHVARSWGAQLRRFVSISAGLLFAVMFVLYMRVFGDNASSGFVDIVLLAFANYTLGTIIVQLVLYIAPYNELGVLIVNSGYYAADTFIGLVTFIFVFFFAINPLTDSIQALLLFNKDVLEASRAGRQLSKFQTRTGSAGAAALLGGWIGGGKPNTAQTAAASARPPAAAPSTAQENVPVGAVAPIPPPAADPVAVLPPMRMDATMTYGTNMAATIMGGLRGVLAPGAVPGSAPRRRQPFPSEPHVRPHQASRSGSRGSGSGGRAMYPGGRVSGATQGPFAPDRGPM
jgi:hypothetical protein